MTEQDGELMFEAEVDLGGLDPGSVRVELYAAPQDGKPAFIQEMHPTAGPPSARIRSLFICDTNAGESPGR